jgi:tetratricopeptide (TPR) repeat protein
MSGRLPLELRSAYEDALRALRLGRAGTAERQLLAIQAAVPGEASSLCLLGAALRVQGRLPESIEALERAVAADPAAAPARVELARALRESGQAEASRELLRGVVRERPMLQDAWYAYGDALADLQKFAEASFAFERARQMDPERARIEQATTALVSADRRTAEGLFRQVLQSDASHVAALCGLAALALGAGNTQDAQRLLRHAQRQSARAPLIQRGLVHTLLAAGRLLEAEPIAQSLLQIEPENPQNWIALGSLYTRLLRQADAISAFEEAARLNPSQVGLRLSIGHANKTLGRREASERAYKECLRINPAYAEAWWSLADLKNYAFSEQEVASMRALLADTRLANDDLAQLHFALGRALEQRADYRGSFAHYATGNAMRRRSAGFDMGGFEAKTARICALLDAGFFAQRAGSGSPDGAPIFIVGLPRSGSTLVEQILASHSRVEGTMELPNILTQVREFDHLNGRQDGYPETLLGVPSAQFGSLGARYLEETRPIRTGRPRFIDKMPNNFSHIGLIHLILPRATVIDVRRHPLDACLSTYKQYFAEGQSFGYDLEDLGRYYRCYLALMDHWDRVLPGKVLHLQYEALVREPEAEIRRLLDHCGLVFESDCLSFHRTRRAVRTASAEQVRQPLYSSAVGYWRHYSAELEPLRRALGDALERFAAWEG